MIGRQEELALLQTLEHADKSAFVAVYGRRRVGKTYLIRTVFENKMVFQLTGKSCGAMPIPVSLNVRTAILLTSSFSNITSIVQPSSEY